MPRLSLLLQAVVLASVLVPRIADSQATLGPGPKVSISAADASVNAANASSQNANESARALTTAAFVVALFSRLLP